MALFDGVELTLRAADLSEPDIGAVWDWCIAAEYEPDRLVSGLTGWLGPPGGKKILDCACGSGFPSLALHRLGYDVTCSDGSAAMLERFRRNASVAGIALEPVEVSWEQAGSLFWQQFDVVLCRGCSFVYAGTWDTDRAPDRSALAASLRGLVGCLRAGGRLYLDVADEYDLEDPEPGWIVHPPRAIEGHQVQLRERVVVDSAERTRHWAITIDVDGRELRLERSSHYLPHCELITLLYEAGFDDVQRVSVPGERYTVFVAEKL